MDVELPRDLGHRGDAPDRAALADVRVVMLTAYAEPDLLFAAMQVGASGYLLKHTPAAELVATLRRIAGGEHVLNPEVASRMLREFRARQASSAPHPLPPLSGREEEVLKLLATGETNRQIARRLYQRGDGQVTCGVHPPKLEVSDRTSAAVLPSARASWTAEAAPPGVPASWLRWLHVRSPARAGVGRAGRMVGT
jgi:FixJ family two-component response regulator